jgi:hypothetical protein
VQNYLHRNASENRLTVLLHNLTFSFQIIFTSLKGRVRDYQAPVIGECKIITLAKASVAMDCNTQFHLKL